MDIQAMTRTFQGREVRMREYDDQVWLHGRDTCQAVGISTKNRAATHALNSLAGDERELLNVEVEGTGIAAGTTYEEEQIFVNEPGMYRLIFRSEDPMAEKFRRWVAHDVLPSIRETGAYVSEDLAEDLPKRISLDSGIAHYLTSEELYTRVADVARKLFKNRRLDAVPSEETSRHRDLPGKPGLTVGEDLEDMWVTLDGLNAWLWSSTVEGTSAFIASYAEKLREAASAHRYAVSSSDGDNAGAEAIAEAVSRKLQQNALEGQVNQTEELGEISEQLSEIHSEVENTGPAGYDFIDWSRKDQRDMINELVNADRKRYGHIYERVARHTGTHPRTEADEDANSVLQGVSDSTLAWIAYFADEMYSAEA